MPGSSGSGSTNVPMPYVPPTSGSDQVDAESRNLYQQTYGNLYNLNAELPQLYQQYGTAITNNPQSSQAYQDVEHISNQGQTLGSQAYGDAGRIGSGATTMLQQVAPLQLNGVQGLGSASQTDYAQGANLINDYARNIAPVQQAALGTSYGQLGTDGGRANEILNNAFDTYMPQQNNAAQSLYGLAGQLAPTALTPMNDVYAQIGTEQGRANEALNAAFDQYLPQQNSAAQSLYGFGSNVGSYASPLMTAAFDPQNALYSQQLQQTRDQAAAAAAQAGLGGSPYSAGLVNDATNNFNIGWQNQQLGRMLSGVEGLNSLGSTMSGAYGSAAGLQNNALGSAVNTLDNAFSSSTNDALAMNQLGTGAVNMMSGAYGAASGLQNSTNSMLVNAANNAFNASRADETLMGQLGTNNIGTEADVMSSAYAPYRSDIAGMTSAASGLGSTFGDVGSLYGADLSLGQSGLDTETTSSLLPYNTLNNQNWQNLAALQAVSGGLGDATSTADNFVNTGTNYLNYGLNATKTAQSGQLQAFNEGQQNASDLWSGVGSLLGLGSSLMNPFSIFGGFGGGGSSTAGLANSALAFI